MVRSIIYTTFIIDRSLCTSNLTHSEEKGTFIDRLGWQADVLKPASIYKVAHCLQCNDVEGVRRALLREASGRGNASRGVFRTFYQVSSLVLTVTATL